MEVADPVPEISVVIPLYQRAHLIGATIRSVLEQTFQGFEIIVIDDGSTDDPAAAIASIGDARARLLSFGNAGASAARNRGIDAARGRFVALLDSDDAFLPHHLATMHELVTRNPGKIAYCPVIADRGAGVAIVKPSAAKRPDETMAEYLMCNRGFVQTSGVVLPTEIARAVRYREDTSFGDDTDFAIRLELAGHGFVMAERPGVIWFDLPDPRRLSADLPDRFPMRWLEDLRPHITKRAYLAYMGWHGAKGLMKRHLLKAIRAYLAAVLGGAYDFRVALVVFAQVFIPNGLYRRLADGFIKLRRRPPDHFAALPHSPAGRLSS